jgi:AcrR family transcriptional regulator
MPAPARSTYHHGALRHALIAAARTLLDEGGANAVGLRETARRVGVSATATYRHFRDKDSLLAAVAAEGFRAFGTALDDAARGSQSLSAMGRAYVEFALANPGLFRLMFGAQIRERNKFPELTEAADAAFARLKAAAAHAPSASDLDASAVAAWALVHGLSHLLLDGMLPRESAPALMDAILASPAG